MGSLYNSFTKLMKYITFTAFLLLLSSCNKHSLVEFSQKIQLSGFPVNKITLFSRGNVEMCVADTFLIVQKAEEPFIQIYSTNTHKLLAEFGSEGRKYGELLGPSLKKQVDYDSRNNSPVVYVFDFKRKRLNTINIFNAINKGSITNQEALPSGDKWLTFFHYKGEDFYVASPGDGGRFLIYDYQTKENILVPYIPKVDFTIPEHALSIVYRSTAHVNSEKNLIVSAPLHFGELNFFDLTGKLIRSTTFEPRDAFKQELTAGIGSFRQIKYQIEDIDVKDGLIYGLNYNSSVTAYAQKKGPYNMKVQVFDWKGNPVKEYYFDNRMITSFAIDETHNRIYTYSPTEMEHTITFYPIE